MSGFWDDVTSFRDKDKSDVSGKTDTLFNRPDQGSDHGHVTSSQTDDGQTQYHYVRDHEGNTYVDDNPNSRTYTGHKTEPPRR